MSEERPEPPAVPVPHPGEEQLREGRRTYCVGDPLPVLLRDIDFMRVLRMPRTVFYQLKKSGRFDRFVVRPQLTRTTRYSGSLIRAWLDGQLSDSRFLASGRRRK